MKYWLAGFLLLFLFIAAGCGNSNEAASVDDIPDEPEKQEIESAFQNSAGESVQTLIDNNFYLLDVVSGEGGGESNVYATRRFTVDEAVNLLQQAQTPEEISDKNDDQQMLIYNNDFITIKPSEEDEDVTLIEVADRTFVRSNYSPNYLNTFFTFALLNQMFGSNWSSSRADQCQSGNCYGGYTTGSNTAAGTTRRGSSSYRGGGPDAGK